MTQPEPTEIAASTGVGVRFAREASTAHNLQYAKGLIVYGTPLKTFNGHSAYRDAMEEWSDLGRYVTQLEMEREYLAQLLVRAATVICPDSLNQEGYKEAHSILEAIEALKLKEQA